MKSRAISPIISDILLAVILVSMFTIIYSASTSITGNISTYFWENSEKLLEDLTIEEAFIKAGNRTVTLYIRNVGQITTIIENIYWNNTKMEDLNGKLTLKVGELTAIKIKLPSAPGPYTSQTVTITTKLGNRYVEVLVSTALGAMLFIIISTTILMMVLTSMMNYQQNLKTYMKRMSRKLEEKIEIIRVNVTDKGTEIYILNSGSTVTNIRAIYLNHILIKELEEYYIPPGSIRKIVLNNIKVKRGDYIKIATNMGNTAATIIEDI